jgi:hypothetical protein
VHQPIDEANTNTTVTVDALIKHISDISSAKVFWREEGSSTFNETSMTLASADNWTADLNIGTVNVEYYIWAESNSGKSLTRPIVAPDGYWTIDVELLSIAEWAQNHISAPYPNPARDRVKFNLESISGSISISIRNLLGQKLFETDIEDGNGIIELDLNENWNGTLFVTFEGSFGVITKKIIKL